jgi:maltose O-acetyltransferase
MIKFLSEKLTNFSIKQLILNQIETLIWELISWIPTLLGFLLRVIFARIFFKNTNGFQWIQTNVTIVNAYGIQLGFNVGINTGTYINGIGGVKIGNYVNIGNNVTLSSGIHTTEGREIEIYRRPTIPSEIIIEDDVWLGAGVVIMPGVKIGKGSVIGANAVVIRDTEEYSINVGAPSKIIGYR